MCKYLYSLVAVHDEAECGELARAVADHPVLELVEATLLSYIYIYIYIILKKRKNKVKGGGERERQRVEDGGSFGIWRVALSQTGDGINRTLPDKSAAHCAALSSRAERSNREHYTWKKNKTDTPVGPSDCAYIEIRP